MVLYAKSRGGWTTSLHAEASLSASNIHKSPHQASLRSLPPLRNPFDDNAKFPDYHDDVVDEKTSNCSKAKEIEGASSGNGTKVKVLLDGPYGITLEDFTGFETVLLVAGGSGVSKSLQPI
jgi:hypothetical protein